MNIDDLAAKIIEAVKDKPEAVKEISNALASGDSRKIREAIARHTGMQLSDVEAQEIDRQVKANPTQPAAYWT